MTTPTALNEERDRRLTRADAKISRCPHCGAWTWRGRCTTTVQARTERGA